MELSYFLVNAVGACLRVFTKTHEAVVGIVRYQEDNHWHQAYSELYSCDADNASQRFIVVRHISVQLSAVANIVGIIQIVDPIGPLADITLEVQKVKRKDQRCGKQTCTGLAKVSLFVRIIDRSVAIVNFVQKGRQVVHVPQQNQQHAETIQ